MAVVLERSSRLSEAPAWVARWGRIRSRQNRNKQPPLPVIAGVARQSGAHDLPVIVTALIGYRVMYSGARKTVPVGVDRYRSAGDFTAPATGDFG